MRDKLSHFAVGLKSGYSAEAWALAVLSRENNKGNGHQASPSCAKSLF